MNDQDLIHEQYKKVLTEANEEPRYNNRMKKQSEPWDPTSWSIDQLTSEINKYGEKIERLQNEPVTGCELTDSTTQRLIDLHHRSIQRLMKIRSEKMKGAIKGKKKR